MQYTINEVAQFGKYLLGDERKKMILKAFEHDTTKTDEEKVNVLYKADIENFIESVKLNEPQVVIENVNGSTTTDNG